MHLDRYGLPCQADGNCADQLNRVGLILVAEHEKRWHKGADLNVLYMYCLVRATDCAALGQGTYTRFIGSTPDDVTCDQLVPTICAWVMRGNDIALGLMFMAMVRRFGFAQNVHKQGEPNTKTIPDFMVARTMPIFIRYSKWLYPLALVFDLYLIVMALSLIIQASRDPDAVDDNNTLVTLYTCKVRHPTFVSRLAAYLYKRFRPTNLGVTKLDEKNHIQGAMAWYHRADNGGNPEIAEMFRPIIEEHFT